MVMRILASMFVAGLLVALAVPLAAPQSADAAIHEKIAAACRKGGEEVVPPGQVRDGMSFVRALQATGIIESIVPGTGEVTINFDFSKPSSKFISAGADSTIPDFFGPGVDLILSPEPMLNPDFAAHANCKNMNP
jgi:hypothetical protein